MDGTIINDLSFILFFFIVHILFFDCWISISRTLVLPLLLHIISHYIYQEKSF